MTSNAPHGSALFRSLHTSARPLALANAWDAAGARIVEAAGAPAIATTSAGVAWSLGAPDGDRVPRDLALDAIARIAAAVTVPVSADIEGGHGRSPEEVADTVTRVLEAGVVGVNIEDGTRPPGALAARLEAVRAAADRAGADVFVNARVDTYLLGLGDPATRLRDTLARARAYVDAGADGVFVPGVTDPDLIRSLADALTVPLNVLAGPGALSVPELGALGVARVSLGSGLAQSAYAAVRQAARELYGDGGYAASLRQALDYTEVNGLFDTSG
ncbi:isocitrate lyase/phosphoenolpyruvate mutase family protein [Streptomyces sp. R302]|uniref:isocitrate lyase/PEP mutase family protein n=1 Tax=unclassified Streptomyces TaxID=2593676 RepID=UPI00145E57A9|nr:MULTISPECIES: isocitrate lyase/phosphoenolpyruvate mutase family protein [unclassified Streptomyces]NML52634.1 isocitrate lyase/phosphoenolpyruvate mutase family protein [Streptomyces sp. R301]NML80437.1 isocitrate lyase/phosphoenolpyruvate mutase family protein [Streptomyces sp. R302]